MICPFCKQELDSAGFIQSNNIRIDHYACWNGLCWSQDFPRYKCSIMKGQESLYAEEYAIGKFYVKVNKQDNITIISKRISAMLFDEVKVPRAIWLNPTNFEATLDKLKFCVTFS